MEDSTAPFARALMEDWRARAAALVAVIVWLVWGSDLRERPGMAALLLAIMLAAAALVARRAGSAQAGPPPFSPSLSDDGLSRPLENQRYLGGAASVYAVHRQPREYALLSAEPSFLRALRRLDAARPFDSAGVDAVRALCEGFLRVRRGVLDGRLDATTHVPLLADIRRDALQVAEGLAVASPEFGRRHAPQRTDVALREGAARLRQLTYQGLQDCAALAPQHVADGTRPPYPSDGAVA
jgi:hypothetical protein